MAFITSFVALATDAMLPAMTVIGEDLKVSDPNHNQYIISLMFLGLAVGQLFYGPWSDAVGRKLAIYVGFVVFLIGCLLSYFSESFTTMMIGRVLQGLGLAGPRVVVMALIRDLYAGRGMARIMSFISAVFIMVPALAPALGLIVLNFSGWRAIFGSFIVLGIVVCLWFAVRQPETLPLEKRLPVKPEKLWQSFLEVLSSRQAFGYTLASGFIFGSFVTYLSTAQQVFEVAYQLDGKAFALWFAILAIFIGVASLVNGALVMKYGMRKLTFWALITSIALATVLLVWAYVYDGTPPFVVFVTIFAAIFFCTGLLFGNLMALCMEPLGHIAGIGAAITSATSNLISIPLAVFVGSLFNGTILPLVAGFVALPALGLMTMIFIEHGREQLNETDAHPR
jgi:MFS transporter, DHA1 family, multidrug resistance protein